VARAPLTLNQHLKLVHEQLAEVKKEAVAVEQSYASKKAELEKRRAQLLEDLEEIASKAADEPDLKPAPEKAPKASDLPPLEKGERGQGGRLVMLLQERPRADLDWLAEKLYRDADKGSLASLLDYLKRTGRVRRVDSGKWEAV